MTNRSERIKAYLAEAKAKTCTNEDAAGEVLRATVAKHKLKRMEGTKKSPALIAKLTARVEAGKRHMTEEAIKKAVKPAPKPVKILTNNPGNGYHGIVHALTNDHAKAHAEYNKMHARVKDWAGEAGHLMHAKKPNLMVRDYLDSSRGRHLEGLQADEKYIKKDFGHFARSYDPKLFTESVDLNEGRTKPTHGVYEVHHAGSEKGMVVHWGGNSSDPAKVEAKARMLNASVAAFVKGKHIPEPVYHYEARPLGNRVWKESVNEQSGDPGDDDHSGVYSVQQRDGRYKNVRIKRQPDGKYHIHHADGSKGSTDLKGVKSYISRNSAAWMNEETLAETTRSQDAQRVQYGVMKHDDYLKKWKIGKYGEKKNSLAGPGGIYKNLLVDRNIDAKSAATKK